MKARIANAIRRLADRLDQSTQAAMRRRMDKTRSHGGPDLGIEKLSQCTRAVTLLERAGYRVNVKNGGLHLQVTDARLGLVEFWPTTGKWWIAREKSRGVGIDSLLLKLGVKL